MKDTKKTKKLTKPPRILAQVDMDTPLYKWLQKSDMSVGEFARQVGVARRSAYWWMTGMQLPGVIYALRVALVTGNAVPMESWLETPKGEEIWKSLSGQAPRRTRELMKKVVKDNQENDHE